MGTRRLVFSAALASSVAAAYPIQPQTIAELTDGAELIVVARETPDPPRQHDGGLAEEQIAAYVLDGLMRQRDPEALLELEEVWKGAALGSVRVPFPESYICPAPPRYVEGARVVAFLRRDAGGAWHTSRLDDRSTAPRPRSIAGYGPR